MNHAQVDVDRRRVEAHREEDPRKVRKVVSVSRKDCTWPGVGVMFKRGVPYDIAR